MQRIFSALIMILNVILCDKIAHAEIPRGLGKKSYIIAFVHMFRSGFVSFFLLCFFFFTSFILC